MDLWSVIPIEVHQYTILSTTVSSISLGNILWKDITCKDLLGKESYLVISFHHSILQLTFITQAWMCKFNTCAMQANIWNAHSKCIIQVHELAPPTCVLKILIDPLPLLYLSPYVTSPYLCELLLPFVIKYHKRWAQILDRLCETMWSEDHFSKFGSI